MPLGQDFLLELKYRNDMESVISSYVNLKRRGSNLVGLCPFHNEKTPSFTVYPENGSYYCFGCSAGGDVITFIRQVENLDYLEAVKLLADRAGLSMPEDGYDTSMQKIKTTVLEINREAARFFHSSLLSDQGRPALDYLLKRKLSMNTIKRFGIGYSLDSWDSLLAHLKPKGYKEEDILQADLISRSKKGGYYDRFRARIMFPIIDIRGSVIAFGGRVMSTDGKQAAKYINSSDTPVFKKSRNIYALNFAKNHGADRMILAEGYMDVIALHQAGFRNAVAALGTAFTAEQAKLLSRYTKEVIVTLDADAAGQKATDRAMNILSDARLSVRVVRLPDGKDPDDFIKKNGASRFEALLDGAVGDTEYKLFMAGSGMDLSKDDGRLSYLKKAVNVLVDIEDTIERDLYAGRLSEQCNVSKTAILAQVEQVSRQNKKKKFKKEIRELISPHRETGVNPEQRQNVRAAAAEEGLIAALMYNPDCLAFVKERIGADDFITVFNRRVFIAVTEMLENGQAFEISLLSDRFAPDEMGKIVSLSTKIMDPENVISELTGCIRVILEEKEKLDIKNLQDLSSDEWEAQMQKIRENKKRGM